LTTGTLRIRVRRDIVATACLRLRAATDCDAESAAYSSPMIWPGRLAITFSLLCGALLLLGAAFVLVAPTPASFITLGLGLAVAPLSAVLGVVIARRPAAPRVGMLLGFVAVVLAAIVARESGAQVLAARPADADALAWLVAATAEGAVWLLVAVAMLLLFFPDGRLPGTRWRWVPATVVIAAAVTQLHGAFDLGPFRSPLQDVAQPFGPPPFWLDVLGAIAFAAVLLLTLASAASLLVRYRRADALDRTRIKWLAIGGIGVALYPFVCGVEILVTGAPGWISAAVGIAGLVGIPIGIAIATLRHHLYDVDRAIAATAAWIAVSAVLATIFALVSVAGGVVLGGSSTVAAAAAGALCALALAPLHRRTTRFVDRHLYPRRRAAFDALETLHRDVSAGRARPEAIQSTLRAALRDDGLVVGVRQPRGDAFVDLDGQPVLDEGRQPIVLDGQVIGVLVQRASTSAGGPSRELLAEIAGRSTALVEVVRLRLELASALREAEASRARLLQIGYQERRRIERDLHDGAQQRLVSLGLAIRLAQRHMGDGTVDVPVLLEDTVTQLATAVGELRQLAQGIRPSSLDDGLEAALARLVQSVPVHVEAEVAAGQLPDEVATTAYFVVSEAVANAVKHANASHIGLRVVREDGRVIVRVSDDGRGGAKLNAGSGLADRVAALGGSLAVTSPVGRGTLVEAALPCAS
jgi:signal transduction histidine kinase